MIGMKRQKTYDVVPAHLLTIRGLSLDFIQQILFSAEQMKELVRARGGDDRLKHKVLATAFFEPSTRTSCSFQAAMLRLGGSVITFQQETSSVKKGESLEDTIQTLSCYCDAIVIRHPVKGSANTAANVSMKPVINAGDGTGEHPTQALLDLFTIKSELGYIGGENPDKPMVVTLLGDLKNG
jgi:aspartate carbamoyltransferase